ncbi:TonB-dependent siderophore receptor [uncultured Pseudomonas sp.]|uniref:TonB-dependent siderophore receptor n=1 Tax=uncultured Pseudomonas sp. TaxID=114707 RepID=UPI0025E80E02|nr:TonB-dependent siderophore receptor [uncultured Pseudomonas sp.]
MRHFSRPFATAARGTALGLLAFSPAVLADNAPAQAGQVLELPETNVQATLGQTSATAPFTGYKADRAQTATKTNTALNETPQAVSVIGSEQLRDQNAQSLAESLRYTAGVNAGQRGRRGLDDFIVRGFVQSAYKFVDGMRTDSDMWIQSDPFAFERIEVLKGPASILYGQIAPGGLINQVSKRPTDEAFAEVGMGLGNYGQRKYTADVSDKLNEDGSLRYRLVGLYSSSDDIVDYVDRDRSYFAPSLTWDINDDTSLTLLASYQKSHYVPIRGLPAEGTVLGNPNGKIDRDRFVGVPGIDDYTTEQQMFGYELEHRFTPDVTFRQKLRYTEYDLDGAFSSPTTLAANKRNYNRQVQWRDVQGEVFTMDNQLNVLLDTGPFSHDLLVGLDWFDFHTDDTRHTSTLAAIDLYNPNYNVSPGAKTFQANTSGTEHLQQGGLYLQDQIKFGDGWNLLLGLRHDESELKSHRGSTRTSTDENATTGRVGLLYAFDSGWSPYISYSESFVPVTGSDANGKTFEPETGEQTEIGLKYQSPGQAFDVTFALYDLKRQNVTTTDPNNSGFSVQVGEQRHRGAEVELHGRLTEKLDLIATYSYIDAEITKSNDGFQGNRPVQVPEHMANAWLRYDLSSVLPGLGVGAGVRYIGEQAGDQANSFDSPDYTLYDMMVDYKTGPWRFAVNGSNLTNKDYVASCASSAQCFPGDPRMLMFSTSYRFY